MIKKISIDEFDDLGDIIDDYLQFLPKNFHMEVFPLKDQLRELLINKSIIIFTLYNEEEQTMGFAVINP
ncbi:MAG: hypothetical protein ACFFAE_22300, partial [Candidatus Hodarchaeota archaeon]